ncbi:MAG: hypothetical protein WCK57_07610 [Verrucomicrobiae bacterium]
MPERIVKRVLVMLDYGPGDTASGEVFDLTDLAQEMRVHSKYGSADISLKVSAMNNYDVNRKEQPVKLTIEWGGYAGEWCHRATHLDDVLNASLPDNEEVKRLRKKVKRLEKQAQDLKFDAMREKLKQVSAVRAQHPIARVTEMPMLPEIAAALPTP